jgi:hypothetical protein
MRPGSCKAWPLDRSTRLPHLGAHGVQIDIAVGVAVMAIGRGVHITWQRHRMRGSSRFRVPVVTLKKADVADLSYVSGGIMRHFKKGVGTFAAAAALLVSAGPAAASRHGASTPAKPAAASSGFCLFFCFEIRGDVVLWQNVSISVAANICNMTVALLNAFLVDQTATCNISPTQTGTITRRT